MKLLDNPWANPMLGGPRKLGGGESITGIDALDGLLRGWVAVEQVQTAKKLAKAGAEQRQTVTTVERPQQVGRQPYDPAQLAPTPAPAGGGFAGFTSNQLLGLAVVAGLVLLVAR